MNSFIKYGYIYKMDKYIDDYIMREIYFWLKNKYNIKYGDLADFLLDRYLFACKSKDNIGINLWGQSIADVIFKEMQTLGWISSKGYVLIR